MSDKHPATAAITRLVQTYVEGMVWGDAALLRSAFHDKASCVGHFDGGLEWIGLEAMIDEFTGDEAAPGTEPYWKMNSIQVIGDTAVACVENDWARARFDDVLTLLHHDGRWQIVSKVFYVRVS